MKKLFILTAMLAYPTIGISQAGLLDHTFSGDGIVTQDIANGSVARAIVVKPNGRIVVAGIAADSSLVIQYKQNGAVDSSFSTDGIFTIDLGGNYDEFNSLAVDDNGRVIVCGMTVAQSNGSLDDIVVVRLLSNGTPDSSFNGDGVLILGEYSMDEEARAVAIQSDGKIVIGGNIVASPDQYFLAVRLNEDGSLDSTFGTNGFAKLARLGAVAMNSMAIQPDGKIVLGGYVAQPYYDIDFALLRLNADGTVDSSFGIDGLAIENSGKKDFAESLALQEDGKIVLGGYSFDPYTFVSDFLLMRFNSDGSPDLSFATNGILSFDFFGNDDRCWSIISQPDGKILAGGWTQQYSDSYMALVRFNYDGSLDSTFSQDGKSALSVFTNVNAGYGMCLQPDNKILQAGDGANLPSPGQVVIVRYLNDVATGIDQVTLTNNLIVYPNPISFSTTISLSLEKNAYINMELFDLAGSKMKTLVDGNLKSGNHEQELNREQLSDGIYFLKVKMNDETSVIKILIQ